MASLSILKADGSEAGTLEVSDAVFAVEPNLHCVRQVVAQQLANRRAGTQSTKQRGDVRGGGRKPYRQKGTGRARQGSIRATQWRGGAIAFGPKPRDFGYRINRKVRRKAFCSIWSDLLIDGRLKVVQGFGLEAPRTRRLLEILDAVGIYEGSVLLVTEHTDEVVALSARNVPWITTLNAENLNVYDMLRHDWVLATPGVIAYVESTYDAGAGGEAGNGEAEMDSNEAALEAGPHGDAGGEEA